jgi:hypothetical protein
MVQSGEGVASDPFGLKADGSGRYLFTAIGPIALFGDPLPRIQPMSDLGYTDVAW